MIGIVQNLISTWGKLTSSLCWVFQSMNMICLSAYKSCACIVRFSPKNFIFWAIVSGTVFFFQLAIKHEFISGNSIPFHWSICLSLCQYHTVFLKIDLYWSIIASQYCVSFCCTTKWISHMHTYVPISPASWASLPSSLSHPSRSSQSTELISLCYAAASHQLTILHPVVYICRCYSHFAPALPSHPMSSSPFSMSTLYSCPATRFISTFFFFFRFYIYALAYGIFLFLTYFTPF